jgi:ABC-type phosphate transport system ATPase subunit
MALYGITMDIPEGLATALIGPSECRTSTLPGCLNRMSHLIDNLTIDGSMMIDGQDVYDSAGDAVALRMGMGTVFQKPAPFAISIFDNVVHPLHIDGVIDRATARKPASGRFAGQPCGMRSRTVSSRARSASPAVSNMGCDRVGDMRSAERSGRRRTP